MSLLMWGRIRFAEDFFLLRSFALCSSGILACNSQQTQAGAKGSAGEFYQTFSKDLTPILLKPFPKVAEEKKKKKALPNSLAGATITLPPKPDKDSSKK